MFSDLYRRILQHLLDLRAVSAALAGTVSDAVFGSDYWCIIHRIGVGICVRQGAAPGGDDALAMSISHLTGGGIEKVYLVSDLIVLGLSISYIPLARIGYSLITVILSGQIIGVVQRMDFNRRR